MKRAVILGVVSFFVLMYVGAKVNNALPIDLDGNQENVEYLFGAFFSALSLIVATFQRHYNRKYMVFASLVYFVYPILCGMETVAVALVLSIVGFVVMNKKTVSNLKYDLEHP